MTSRANVAPSVPKENQPYRILVVEDDAMIAWDLSLVLQEAGFAVCGTASSGSAAVDLVRATRPDLVLMDVNLRGALDGVDTVQLLRTLGLARPVIFVTGFGDPHTAGRIRDLNPAGYVLKPVLKEELIEAIARALGA